GSTRCGYGTTATRLGSRSRWRRSTTCSCNASGWSRPCVLRVTATSPSISKDFAPATSTWHSVRSAGPRREGDVVDVEPLHDPPLGRQVLQALARDLDAEHADVVGHGQQQRSGLGVCITG